MMWLAVKGAVHRNLSTMPDRLMGIMFDITAQKEVEERGRADECALRSEGRTRTRADAASPAVFLEVCRDLSAGSPGNEGRF